MESVINHLVHTSRAAVALSGWNLDRNKWIAHSGASYATVTSDGRVPRLQAPWTLSHEPYSADRRRYRIDLSAERVPDSGRDLRHHDERRRARRGRGFVRSLRDGGARGAASHSAREHAAGADADGAG